MPKQQDRSEEILAVRLTRKFAEAIDGINLADAHVGDRLELPQHEAEVLIAEGWAELIPRRGTTDHPRAQAADRSRPGKRVKR